AGFFTDSNGKGIRLFSNPKCRSMTESKALGDISFTTHWQNDPGGLDRVICNDNSTIMKWTVFKKDAFNDGLGNRNTHLVTRTCQKVEIVTPLQYDQCPCFSGCHFLTGRNDHVHICL